MSAFTSGRGQQAHSCVAVLQQVVPSGHWWVASHDTFPTCSLGIVGTFWSHGTEHPSLSQAWVAGLHFRPFGQQ